MWPEVRARTEKELPVDPIVYGLSGDPATALRVVLGAIHGLGYRISAAPDGWSGRAEVGSAVGRAFGGGFTRRMLVDYRVEGGPHGPLLIITAAATGWSGGVLGASKAKKEFRSIAETVAGALHQYGMLVMPPGAAPGTPGTAPSPPSAPPPPPPPPPPQG